MRKLNITEFNKGKVRLNGDITCSVGQVIKLGLLGYLYSDSELRLRQYLVLRGIKVLGGLTDYRLEVYHLKYQGQEKEVKLQIPLGVVDLDECFWKSDIEKATLHGEEVVSLRSLAKGCKLLKEVLVDVDFSDEVIDLSWCFSGTECLQQVIFSKMANRVKLVGMFWKSGIKEIRLSDYVLNVEDSAWDCFYCCKMLESLDCSGVKFNNGLVRILGYNPKLETISFRNCWFGERADLTWGSFLHPVTIDLRGARCKGIEKVKSLSAERKSNKAVDEFIAQFELDKVTLILD